MDYFISMIQLNQILGFAQRTLVRDLDTYSTVPVLKPSRNGFLQYSTRKSRMILGYVGKRWESHIVSALETALRKWAGSVPPHRMTLSAAVLEVPLMHVAQQLIGTLKKIKPT